MTNRTTNNKDPHAVINRTAKRTYEMEAVKNSMVRLQQNVGEINCVVAETDYWTGEAYWAREFATKWEGIQFAMKALKDHKVDCGFDMVAIQDVCLMHS